VQGVVQSTTAPADTSLLWYDTSATGTIGIPGPGVATGGTIGQALVKTSATDYDTEWTSIGSAARPLLTGGAYLSGSGLVLSGLSANYASTPDSAALSITGDIDIQCKVAMTDWTPSAVQGLVFKYGLAGTRSYRFQVDTAGTLTLTWSTDGTAINTRTSTVATGFADGVERWVRVTLDVDNGASGHDVAFWTSTDGVTWSQLGTTVTTAGTTSIFDSSALLAVGADSNGNTPATGTVYRAIVKNGIGGTTVFDADFSTQTADALAFTESSTNAATVTINTTRYSYGIPNVQSGALGTGTITSGVDRYQRFVVTQSIVVDMVLLEVTTGPSVAATVYFGLYACDADLQPSGNVLLATDIAVDISATGVFTKQVTPVTLPAGTYVFASNTSANLVARRLIAGDVAITGGYGATGSVLILASNRTAASFVNNPSAWNTIVTTSTVGSSHFALLRWKAAT
jgi:hypothetical protein